MFLCDIAPALLYEPSPPYQLQIRWRLLHNVTNYLTSSLSWTIYQVCRIFCDRLWERLGGFFNQVGMIYLGMLQAFKIPIQSCIKLQNKLAFLSDNFSWSESYDKSFLELATDPVDLLFIVHWLQFSHVHGYNSILHFTHVQLSFKRQLRIF